MRIQRHHASIEGVPAAGHSDLPELVVLTRGEASAYLTSPAEGPRVTCVVSIGDVGEELPPGYQRVPHRLRLEFDDVEHEGAGNLATADDIRKLIAFAETVRTAGGTTVVHCRAAVGRSPAAAYILFAALLGPGREGDAVDALLERKPFVQPNRWMIRLADDELHRDGRLLGALVERLRR